MAKNTDLVNDQATPRVFERASTPVNSIEGLFALEVSTPSSSAADESRSVFSPNESVSTDITEDYGWDSPSSTRSRSLSRVRLFDKDKESDITEGVAAIGPSRSVTSEDAPHSFATPVDLPTRASWAANETGGATGATEEEIDRKNGNLVFTRIWDQCSVNGSKGSIDAQGYNKNREISLSLAIDMNFSNRRQSFNVRPRAKSSIHPISEEVTRHIKSATPSESSLEVGPRIQVTPPDSPADKSPYIRSIKPTRGDIMTSLSRILPIWTRQFLVQNQKNCVAIKKGTNTRCAESRDLNIQPISKGLDALSISNIAGLSPALQDLCDLMLCGAHQKEAKKSLASWFGDEPTNHLADHLPEIKEWISALKRSASVQQTANTTSNVDSALVPVEKRQPSITLVSPGYPVASPIQKFEPYAPKCHDGKSVSQMLREVLTKPLTKREIEKSGMIYIFWYQGNFGHLKIGLTNNLDDRLRAWEKCGKPLDVHFPLTENDKLPVQHIYRVERLIHTELKEHRLKEECLVCNKTHTEWFRVSNEAAVSAVRKWMGWMRKHPYACKTMEDGKTEWRLDIEERVTTIADLCTPSTEPVSSTTPKKHNHSISRLRPPGADYSKRKRRAASASF
ncbi:T5orf172 domain-containing protein [Aspergillus carlsbadensis]|nr:T5orf172 domain-containing protein [Aspergillus carlsbadensis]